MPKDLKLGRLSGRRDSNPGPLAPKASALAGLRYAPITLQIANFLRLAASGKCS
jgi:hypothetical protein